MQLVGEYEDKKTKRIKRVLVFFYLYSCFAFSFSFVSTSFLFYLKQVDHLCFVFLFRLLLTNLFFSFLCFVHVVSYLLTVSERHWTVAPRHTKRRSFSLHTLAGEVVFFLPLYPRFLCFSFFTFWCFDVAAATKRKKEEKHHTWLVDYL